MTSSFSPPVRERVDKELREREEDAGQEIKSVPDRRRGVANRKREDRKNHQPGTSHGSRELKERQGRSPRALKKTGEETEVTLEIPESGPLFRETEMADNPSSPEKEVAEVSSATAQAISPVVIKGFVTKMLAIVTTNPNGAIWEVQAEQARFGRIPGYF
ncbi:hypothetical protein NDU88_003492 [Pleurodeles waltl]|uniref:Uncharacterized protein n=1 Tax=Pleurodeles waltl TaxID=8319 RepID=A0AAV7TPX1_PLEWA|nr:hypothetical protein NDU88_003492 [Pleurodeles waltl]